MENIYLIQTESHKEANQFASKIEAANAAVPDDTLLLDGKKAKWIFFGVRKTVECIDTDLPPVSGREISYLQAEVETLQDVERLYRGEEVKVVIDRPRE